eukprot:g5029.t1
MLSGHAASSPLLQGQSKAARLKAKRSNSRRAAFKHSDSGGSASPQTRARSKGRRSSAATEPRPKQLSTVTPGKRALIVCQAFPPLLKNAGGVAKRYLTLCGTFIDEYGWTVTIVTPVNVLRSGNKRVERWLHEGSLVHIPARGVSVETEDGLAVFLDLFSTWNTMWFMHILSQHQPGYDVCLMDDVPWRAHLLLLLRAFNVPTIVTSHTDATHLESFKTAAAFRSTWRVHMWSAKMSDVHASVSKVFGKILSDRECTPVNAYWPPILWSPLFRADPDSSFVEEARNLRSEWLDHFRNRDGFEPRTIFLCASRWANEKRILEIFPCIPEGCGLVIVGDGTSMYSDQVATSSAEPIERDPDTGKIVRRPPPQRGILALRKMLNATDLRIAYQACDVFVSASAFETLGNTIIESLCSGTPVAVQPAQGHLEHVVDGVNSWFVDYDDVPAARAKLKEIAAKMEASYRDGKPCLPEMKSIGRRFRESNFAREFYDGVIETAFEAKRRRSWESSPCWRVVELLLIAPINMILWMLLWLIMRIVTRFIYFLSSHPKFTILDHLGGSIENPQPRTGKRPKNIDRRHDRNARRKVGSSAGEDSFPRTASEEDLTGIQGHYKTVLNKGQCGSEREKKD